MTREIRRTTLAVLAACIALACVAPLALAGAAGAGGHSVERGTVRFHSLVWNDSFSGPVGAPPNVLKWEAVSGDWSGGDGELEYYTSSPSNVSLDGSGHLAITARREDDPGTAGIRHYTSGRVDTAGLFETTYGRIEARIKLPAGRGLWPAFWGLAGDVSTAGWPAAGELDVMENLGSNPFRTYAAVHGPARHQRAGFQDVVSRRSASSLARGFHVYGMDWSPGRIVFTLDGVRYATRTPASLPAGSEWVFNRPFFLVLNLAVGGHWGGPPSRATHFPATMLVDWVRVYA
jgi:beta-glucanase (GH16 family)